MSRFTGSALSEPNPLRDGAQHAKAIDDINSPIMAPVKGPHELPMDCHKTQVLEIKCQKRVEIRSREEHKRESK